MDINTLLYYDLVFTKIVYDMLPMIRAEILSSLSYAMSQECFSTLTMSFGDINRLYQVLVLLFLV